MHISLNRACQGQIIISLILYFLGNQIVWEKRGVSVCLKKIMDPNNNTKTTFNCSSKNEKNDDGIGEAQYHEVSTLAVHSQVIKIKKEIEKIKHPSLQQLHMRRRSLHLKDVNRLRSRSPLGLAERAILVGHS